MDTTGHEKRDPLESQIVESAEAEEIPLCTKAFASETARAEDEDSPCRNAEG